MKSRWRTWALILTAVLLLLSLGRLEVVLIAVPLSLLFSYLAVSAERRKIWNRR